MTRSTLKNLILGGRTRRVVRPLHLRGETLSEPARISEVGKVAAPGQTTTFAAWEKLVQPRLIVGFNFGASDDEVASARSSHRRQTLIGEFGEFVEWPFEDVPPIAQNDVLSGIAG